MLDPTRETMLERLQATFAGSLGHGIDDDNQDEFDLESAVYWFASDYHTGQWSNLYRALSSSPYTPSPLAKGIDSESELAQEIYFFLVREFYNKPNGYTK